MIKAAFFDIDGTLVSFKTHHVPESAIRAVENLRRQGVKVFLATGRHPIWVKNLGFEFDGFVALNGGYCTTRTGEVIYKQALSADDFKAMLKYQHEVEPFACACVLDSQIYVNYINDIAQGVYNLVGIAAPEIRDIDQFADLPVYQLIAFFNSEQEKNIMKVMPHSVAARWHPDFADVVPLGINKAVGSQHVLSRYDISQDEIIAFGDGGNDIAMLQFAGIGVAMGNAADEVKASADYVTSSVDEDGIAKALAQYIR